ncbi:uncharacterized protein B0I36DRAFT_320013 [Microdochium trichocladiopsis]|uniref:U4/U6.U5 small nuclear ribonucleoprotein 27kDa protein domain-containing protein n=1 Tax=Microdochium trichocladiopsis TaxID=1682393 RepID=A0A9P8YAG3_9PEZI|nr:uncharacterized protein B0I36DRAFT_320013 [Microdochium trichocladiopsis]KAH7032774.1 hypothetical protein B0I36DRAFT_320013 [Microdochium trichocladiopsis]
MADQPRRGRNRPDSSQMWDEADRRSNHARHDRDSASGRHRNERGGGDDYSSSRRHNNNNHGNRSRSRSPRRDRDRDAGRDHRNRDRDYDRRGGHRVADGRHDGRYRDGRDDRERHSRHNHSPPPRRSRSPPRGVKEASRSEHNSPLPSRPKSDRASGKNSSSNSTPLSIKVGGHSAKNGAVAADHDARDSIDDDREQERRSRGNSAYAEERRSRSPGRQHDHDAMDEDREQVEGEDDDDEVVEDDGGMDMAAMMGFGGFGTTKGKKVTGNNAYYVRKEKKTEYRQYMNRVGGFNRPLSPTRD